MHLLTATVGYHD